MEANRKRSRGFLKGKLIPFHRAPNKPVSTAQHGGGGNKLMKASQPTVCPASSLGILVHQDYAIAPPKSNVSILVADNRYDVVSRRWEDVYGAGDESVDTKAAIYISTVQERLKLEHLNSEQTTIQDNHA